jgi:hypothetical protein
MISRHGLAGLLAVVTAASAAVTWTVTTTPIDNADAAETASAAPIVVADAYHGVGFIVCTNGEQPVAVADAYHGTGTIVCP